MSELVYEYDSSGGLSLEVWIVAGVFAAIGLAIFVWPKLTEIGFTRRFRFGLSGRWVGIVPIAFIGFIVGMHYVMERKFARDTEAVLEASPSTITAGCLDRFRTEIGGIIVAVEIDGTEYSGVGLHNWQRLLSTVRTEFEIGDPIQVESINGEIVRVWRPTPGSINCTLSNARQT